MGYILAIDQGTTSSRAILFNPSCGIVDSSQQELKQIFPDSGWVEHSPNNIWQSTIATCSKLLQRTAVPMEQIAGIGITNQRETTLVWNQETGDPVYNAIVWQDRRTAVRCAEMKQDGYEQIIQERTGLLLDPYFSASKVQWILDRYDPDRTLSRSGKLLFGTVDSYLVWKMTKGKNHVTDATNAARTMLYNIHTGCWDEDICALFGVPTAMLPEVHDCASHFGDCHADILGATLPIRGVAGDQQSASLGQACTSSGMVKSTYGTGCFALMNTGEQCVTSTNRLLSTVAYQLDGRVSYALEGSIFIAGAAVQWLRDGLGIINNAAECQPLAEQADPQQQLYLVPAFTGLGAPHWDPDCRGAIYGLTRNSGPAEIVKATLESIALQTKDLMDAINKDCSYKAVTELRVDGGMSANNWLMQCLADVLDLSIARPQIQETTALGAAWLAGMHAGIYPGLDDFAKGWQLERTFEPTMEERTRKKLYQGWQDAVRRTLSSS